MDSHHLKGRPVRGGGGGGGGYSLPCDEMWRYLLLCIIRSTGDYTLDPQREDFLYLFFSPQLSKRGGILAWGQKKNILSSPLPPSNPPPLPSFLGVHARYSLQLIIQIHFEMQGYTLSGLF